MTSTDLSPRHQRVARLVGRGFTYQTVANEVGISVRTVRHYVAEVADAIGDEYEDMQPKVAVMQWWHREGKPA